MKSLKKIHRRIFPVQKPSEVPEQLIFNEAVLFEKQCIFIAIPKTGSTAIRSQLKQPGTAFIPNSHLSILQVREALYVYYLKNALGCNIGFPTKSIPSDQEIRAKADMEFNSFFKFSAVRNPWARAVSLYYRHDGTELRDKISFGEFCTQHKYASDTCHHPTLHKNQLDWLTDENGKILMDYVYKLENLNSAVDEINKLTKGRLSLKSRRENINPDSRAKNYRDMYTDRTKKLIAKAFEKDIDHFKYTF